MAGIPAARVVAVVAKLDTGRTQIGSGYLLDATRVLTARHCTFDRQTGRAATELRVVRANNGVTATVIVSEASPSLDVAVLAFNHDAPWAELPGGPVTFGEVDREHTGQLSDCEAVGYPLWQGSEAGDYRDLAELHGSIRALEGRESLRLVLRDPILVGVGWERAGIRLGVAGGAALAADDQSVWGGLSGAAVFYSGLLLGVIIEHHPRQGETALQIRPITAIAAASDDATVRLAEALGIDQPGAIRGIEKPYAAGTVLGLNGPASNSPDAADVLAGTDRFFDGRVSVYPSEGSLAVPRADHVTYYSAPRPPISWPVRIGVIPSEADNFQHRKVVEDLDAAMSESETAIVCQVLSGTGGVGKTQLVAHYARQKWSAAELDLLVWVTAGNRDAIVSAYARAGRRVAVTNDSDPTDAAEEFQTWLETTDRKWLVVLDDLAEPADLNGLWPPRNSTGRTIVTTRRRDAAIRGTGRRLVTVDLFTSTEAFDYLTATLTAHDRQDDPEQVRALAKDLGLLPLALAQAAAYLIDRQLGCAEYRRRFADRRRTLAELLPEEGALPDEQRTTVATTWSLSVELADQLNPRGFARPMLQLASMLDANGIPLAVLTSPSAEEYLESHRALVSTDTQIGSPLLPAGVSKDVAREALYCLHRLNLADLTDDTDERSVRVHSLIQRATRDQLTVNQFDDTVHACAQALLQTWASAHTIADNAILRANSEAIHFNAGPRLWSLGAHSVLFQAGHSLSKDRLIVRRGNYWEQLRLAAEEHLGPDHPDTFYARHYVAGLHAAAGDRAGAIAELEKLLADQLRVLGPDHPVTFSTGHSLANRRASAGDRAGAIAELEKLLADQLRVLGPDHPTTFSTRDALASQRGKAGDQTGAIAAWEELLADRVRILGPDHPDAFSTRAVLANWRASAGDRGGAIAAWEELLADQVRVLGPDHPDAFSTRAALADQRVAAGDRAGAIAAWEELLADRVRVLGPDHPDAFSTRAALAHQRGAAGDRGGAIAAWEELLADRVRVLGPDHPDAFSTRAALADQRVVAGDRAGAIAAWEELLADRVRVLGPDHSDAFSTRAALAHQRGAAGDRAGAIAAWEELLADRTRVLGPDHPATLSTRAALSASRDSHSRSPNFRGYTSKRQYAHSSAVSTSDDAYFVQWRAADGTEQSMGPFSNVHAEEVSTWIRRGKGTAIEIVKHPGEEPPA